MALAALELFVHLHRSRAPDELTAIPADIPASLAISRIRVSQLEDDWRANPAPEHLAEVGGRWLREGKTAVLTIPSAVIPQETNYLLNPLHPTFGRIRTGTPQRFSFGPRMWQRR